MIYINNSVDDPNEKQGEVNNVTKSVSQLFRFMNCNMIISTDPVKINTFSIKLKVAIHAINFDLYHVLEKLQGSTNILQLLQCFKFRE